MTEQRSTKGGRRAGPGGASQDARRRASDDRESVDRRTELSEQLDRLLSAAHGLAATIAQTERIAGRSAEIAVEQRRLRRSDLPDGLGLGGGQDRGDGGAETDPRSDGRTRTPRVAERLVPLAEVARRTGRHPDLLRRWCLEGRLDGVRVGRVWCLPERTIAELGGFQRRHRPPPVGRAE